MPAPEISATADRLFDAESRAMAESPPRRPVATYRLQLHKGFGLADATRIVPYLHALGVSDLYLSPYLDARPGSTHGYDVFDHGRINPEVGDEPGHDRMVAELAERGMGRVLDVVPNHMGINGPNRFWLDVLEMGPYSPFASFFDIDWHPVKDELDGRVLLPILGGQYGEVLESGALGVERHGGTFSLLYGDTRLPLSPRSLAVILGRASEELPEDYDPEDPAILEFLSIWESTVRLPSRTSNRPEDIEHRLRERRVLPRRIARLCEDSPEVCAVIDRAVASLRGTPGDPSSFDALHALLEEQVYRLAYWRVAAQEINYRRFFDINDLAGLRTEDPRVFEAIHAKIFAWVASGGVTGLRIDHPDGLADPDGYFRNLQLYVFLIRCRARFDAEGLDPKDWLEVAMVLRRRFKEALADKASPLHRPFPVVAEKILSRGEDLPGDWPIDGTVGYEYLNALNGLFVDPASADAIDACYAEFTGDREAFTDLLYRSKMLIAEASLASEINMLARQLNRVSERDRRSRDFTLDDIREAIREAVACFPVYRTYIRPGEPVSARDRGYIEQAIARARRRNPSVDATLFEFLRSALLLEHPEGTGDEGRALREAFVVRFQQTTGPVQAKGLEDTAFYRQVKLASLNEVGADPWRFGTSPGVFHALNAQRLSSWPGALNTTATHDTKRGEDARIRINVLSELPEDWKTHLARWSRVLSRRKAEVHEAPAPDSREEYLFYQALLGSWPFAAEAPPEGFADRMLQYMIKATREAKVNTSWNDPDSAYADALGTFVHAALDGPDAALFLKDFLPFQQRIARVGVVHSLAQTLLKVASPGVPDVYQGCESWDLSLVDPDNRRPVDYEARKAGLERIDAALASGDRAKFAREWLEHPEDGVVKQYVLTAALRHRREHPDVYAHGVYRPLEADGEGKAHVIAFGRHRAGRAVIAVAPRLVASLMGEDGTRLPLGPEVWGSTRLLLPEGAIPRRWHDLMTDRTIDVRDVEGAQALPLADLFAEFPVALLTAETGQHS